jgi:protein-S-isoprenylcysteine O-methyltransferase Ste14
MPPRTTATGWEPRAVAIGGTFFLILLTWLPRGEVGREAMVVATLLIAIGTATSIWCLAHLGRSFAVLASARALVTSGPYGIVRHPLYLAEAVTTVGIVIAHWSLWAVLVGAAQFALQFRRMQHEERVLRAAFPDYGGYAQRVGMVWPKRATVSA